MLKQTLKRKTFELTSKRKVFEVEHILSIPIYTPIKLAQATPHPAESRITFDEPTHKYSVQFNMVFETDNITSVSQFIHEYFEHFDADAVIQTMINRANWNQSCYYGMTTSEIKTSWENNGKNASAAGTAIHACIECMCNGWVPTDIYLQDVSILQWLDWKIHHFDKEGLVPFRTEFRMFSDENTRIVGTADLFAIKANHPPPNETNGVLTLHIRDWKHSKAIHTVPFQNKCGKNILSHLPDTNYEHYALQQNLYKFLIEEYYPCWNYQGYEYTSCK